MTARAARRTAASSQAARRIVERLGERSLVLVGMMGAGKTSVGRRLAAELSLPFTDADHEIERAANLSIPEIFATYGEAHFRDGERRVIARLIAQGPRVIATGGGAFMAEETRALAREHGVTIWLKAALPVLMTRVRRRSNRPLLKEADPEAVMRRLLAEREPVYATADITVVSRDVPQAHVAAETIAALDAYLSGAHLASQT